MMSLPISSMLLEKLSEDPKWQKEAEVKLENSYDKWWDTVNDPDAERISRGIRLIKRSSAAFALDGRHSSQQ